MLDEMYNRMFEAFGSQHWWPGDSALEIMVGAVLTQNTSWTNVESAIRNLREANLLHLHQLYEASDADIESAIRPAGYFRVKTQRLKNLLGFVTNEFGNLDAMFEEPLEELRPRLLSVNGVGPETADAILLYAGNMPTFVVDAYTTRIVERHGWVPLGSSYETIKRHFETQLSPSVAHFNEFHALIVQIGKHHCKPTPRCDDCPLKPMLPSTGIVGLPPQT